MHLFDRTCPSCVAGERHPRSVREDDGVYLGWLVELLALLQGRRRPYAPAEDERQFVERAVFDGVLFWVPNEPLVALTPAGELIQRHALLPQRSAAREAGFERTPYVYWLEAVLAYLGEHPDASYPLAPAEQGFAEEAVSTGRLISIGEGSALALPRRSRPPAGPYR